MMKKLFSIACLLTIGTGAFSQGGQTDWWYFGATAGVHFTPSPGAVTNGQVNTSEGVATISDANGNLLFYSDGITVYNANHAVMTNGTGLMGNGSSAQSGVVVPRPGSSTEYYLFTVAPYGGTNGLRYSHINMSASGGLGAVTTGQKNVWIMGYNTEKIAAIPKTGGGFWVLCPKYNSDTMYAFAVTSAGVNATPVKSATGVYTGNPNGSVSYLKPNLAGDRLVGGSYSDNKIALYDFNKSNGVTSNGFTFTAGSSTYANYGVEFSPNGNLVYAQGWGIGNCRQYDINAGNATAIANSVVNLGPNSSGGGAIQLGKDGKMYLSRYGQTYMDRIDNPDVQGTGCTYTAAAVSLSSRQCRWGLPTFIQAFFGATVTSEFFCFGDSTVFTADTNNVDSILWNFGDPNSGSSNFATSLTAGHIFSDTGTFNVILVAYALGLTDTIEHPVYIFPRQTANLGADFSLCSSDEFVLNVDQPYATYEWHDNSTDSVFTISYPDSNIMVTVFGVCDTVSDTLHINFITPFVPNLGVDRNICTYQTTTLNPGLPNNYLFIWNTGSSQPTLHVTDTGTYMVTVTDGLCTFADTVHIGYYPEVTVELGHDSSFCYEASVILAPLQNNGVTYNWSNGATSQNLTVVQSGMYTVTVNGIGGHCHAVDSVQWNLYFEPQVDLGPDAMFCHDDVYTINTNLNSPLEFLWNNNSAGPSLSTSLVGLYWVEVSDEHCSMRDSIIISHHPQLEVTLGEDINTCEGKTTILSPVPTHPVTGYRWSDGSTNPTLTVNGHGTYSVTVDDGYCDSDDDVNIFYFEYPVLNLGPDTAMCPGGILNFDVTIPGEIVTYNWFDGSTAPTNTIKVKDSASYWVEITNVVCTSTDSIFVKLRDVPSTDLGRDTTICEGDLLKLKLRDDERILGSEWSTGDTSRSIVIADSGVYTVSIFDGYCNTPGKIRVKYRTVPTDADIKLKAPSTICIGEEISLDARNPLFVSYLWEDGSTSSRHTITSEGMYWVRATHACGVLTDTVRIDRCECPIWLPNAFNPDGNSNNDRFRPESECGFKDYRFSIFDRWGEELFYSEDPEASWDGTFNGQKASIGTYTWKLYYIGVEENKEFESNKTGTVVLIR